MMTLEMAKPALLSSKEHSISSAPPRTPGVKGVIAVCIALLDTVGGVAGAGIGIVFGVLLFSSQASPTFVGVAPAEGVLQAVCVVCVSWKSPLFAFWFPKLQEMIFEDNDDMGERAFLSVDSPVCCEFDDALLEWCLAVPPPGMFLLPVSIIHIIVVLLFQNLTITQTGMIIDHNKFSKIELESCRTSITRRMSQGASVVMAIGSQPLYGIITLQMRTRRERCFIRECILKSCAS